MEIRQLQKSDQTPFNLLLSADPSKDLVEEYVKKGITYVGIVDNKIMGVYVLLKLSPNVIELKNIAVDCNYQGKGYGKKLIYHALDLSKNMGMTKVEIGTGNSSLSQLALYQKCGFRITGVEKDFFIKIYPEEIIENGIICRDMIRLAVEL